ncbi:MAG: hypothetical protein EBV19_09415, partial [Flavobacteriia bacterium]|nr:hypothetical protein [Flavobacteriia bacterium]
YDEIIKDPVACVNCNEVVCIDCFQTGLLLDIHEPRCMFCKKPIVIEYIMKITPRSWIIDDFFPHLGNIRMESEKNMLIHVQDQARKLLEIKKLRQDLRRLPSITKLKKRDRDKVDIIRAERRQLQSKIMSLTDKQNTKSNTTPRMLGFCPKLKCKGFIMENGSCGICNTIICTTCGEITAENHTCNDDIIKNYKSMQKETKRCPGCSIAIYQISGCDQMWCVMCHTPFSWKTGQRVDGVIHNPHYYDWLFTNPIQRVEIDPCMDIPDATQYLSFIYHRAYPHGELYMNIHMTRSHLNEVALNRLRADRVPSNEQLRIKYLMNEINEDTWCRLLQHRERRRLKLNALYLVTEMVVHVLSDMIRMSIQKPEHDVIVTQIKEFAKYVHEQYDQICQIHGGKLPSFIRLYIR